jgi:hypothetical protein
MDGASLFVKVLVDRFSDRRSPDTRAYRGSGDQDE